MNCASGFRPQQGSMPALSTIEEGRESSISLRRLECIVVEDGNEGPRGKLDPSVTSAVNGQDAAATGPPSGPVSHCQPPFTAPSTPPADDSPLPPGDFPDGGWPAWRVVLGSLCLIVPTYGLMSSVGLFQLYWQLHQLRDSGYSATGISWIISVFGFLTIFLGVQAGILFDRFGARPLLVVGSAVYGAAFLGLAFGSTYAHFMVCFVVAGIGAAILTMVAFSVVSHWFDKRRGVAMGVCTMGTGLGGILFAVVLRLVLDALSWRDAILCLAAIVVVFVAIGSLFVESRLPKSRGRAVWDLSLFGSLKFLLFSASVFGMELVLYTAWGLIPTYALVAGFGEEVGFYLIMALNAASTVGRLIPGILSDRYGSFNVIIAMMAFTVLAMLLVWLPFGERSLAALYVASVCLGFGTGSFVSLAATCLSYLCDARQFGKWLGSCYTIVSFADLIANPISLVILASGGPKALVGFQAAVLFASLLVSVVVRQAQLDWQWRLWLVKM